MIGCQWTALVALCLALTGSPAEFKLMRSSRARRSENVTNITQNEHFFLQKLDHANPTEKRVWKQRYFRDSKHYQRGGPAIIYIGGECPQAEESLKTSIVMDIAKEFRGKAFLLEHRFYGASHPTEDLSLSNLRWLTAAQALGDVAYFIEYLRKQGEITADSKVVAYGCSYSGNLAAWARLKYPHLVHAAVAASAPLRAQAEFPEYFQEVARVLGHYGGKDCMERFRQTFIRIDQLVQSPHGFEKLKRYFNVCEPFIETPEDKEFFIISLTDAILGIVESHDMHRSKSEAAPAGPSPLENMCLFMASDFHEGEPDELVWKLAAVNGNFSTDEEEECYDPSFSKEVEVNRNETWNENVNDDDLAADGRQWLYQTCTEFGYFTTMTKDSFGAQMFPFTMAAKLCEDSFGIGFGIETIRNGVANTNLQFGGDQPDLNRVVFVNADMDPWRVLSVNQSLHELAPDIIIKDGHHCQELSESSNASEEARVAREELKSQLRRFLEDQTLTFKVLISDSKTLQNSLERNEA